MMARTEAATKLVNNNGESRVIVRLLVALVVLALVAAGCGSVEQSLEAGSETSATTAADVTTTVATSASTSTSTTATTTTAAVTTAFAEDSFIGRRTDSDDSYRVDVSLEDLLSIESLRFVSGPVVGVETGPTHKWETNPETGREDRIDVPFDSPEAMSQMLHIEIAPRHLAGPDLSEFGNTVIIGMSSSPGGSASAVFDELSILGDFAFFLIKSPVTDYRADLWSDLLDGEAIGLVEADRSVNFPSYAMRAAQIDNVDTFVENVLADAGFETRSLASLEAIPDAGEVLDTSDDLSADGDPLLTTEIERAPCDQSLSFLGEIEDAGTRATLPESIFDIRAASEITVLGRITAVEPGPTHAWVPERIEVEPDDPRAKVQVLHFTLDVDRAQPSSASVGQSVQFAFVFSPGTDHELVEASWVTDCELVVFLFNGPVTNYDPDVWSTVFDGGAIGVVNGGRVEFPNAFEYIEALPIVEVEELFSTS